MKKKAEETKYTLPSIPDELKRATTEREKAYLGYIKALLEKVQQDFMTGFLHKEEFQRRQDVANDTGAYLFIDGDGLKKINDEMGHEAGHAAILAIANGIKQALRARDASDTQIMRAGGDEFVIFIKNISLSTATIIANRVLDSVRKQKILDFYKGTDAKSKEKLTTWPLSVSIGVGKTREESDKAMYKAKANGRGRVEFYTEEKTSSLEVRLIRLAKKLEKSKQVVLSKKVEVFIKIADTYYYHKGHTSPLRHRDLKKSLHRTDGPAVILGERPDAHKEYWIDGEQIGSEKFNEIRWSNDLAILAYYKISPNSIERALAEIRMKELN
jgi:diguanylate cyclase (GGDEF)-like protein